MTIKSVENIIVRAAPGRIRDARSATLSVVESTPGRKPNIRNPVRNYGDRQTFVRPEYNLIEIGVIEDVESYVRQAFQKKAALMFKEGEKFTGKNKETIDYIKKRLLQMEYVSGVPWRMLLRQTGYALISRSNYFWVKVRNESASGGRSIGGVAPVAAYFGMGPEHVTVKRDINGRITHYRQEIGDGRLKEFPARDVIHFYAHRKDGFTFGTPSITPVKDDIRALRRIEENVELMIYQHLFPIFQYKVGTETKPAGDIRLSNGQVVSEVDYVREQISHMPAEGGIVTPERHEIQFIGAERQVLKAKEYLDYFKQRVLSGLGISGVDIGEGDTANRATADSMSRALVDSVKDYQDLLEDFIDKEVIQELLLESTFSFDVLDELNTVKFRFLEIDIEEQMKKNTNSQVMYNGNIIDIDEARESAGYEPITPEQEEKMFSKRVSQTEIEVQAEGQLQVAKTRGTGTATANKAKNSNAPTNQYGTKTGPQSSRQDYVVKDTYAGDTVRMVKNDLAYHIKTQIIDRKWIGVLVDLAKDRISKRYRKETEQEFYKGVKDAGVKQSQITDKISAEYSEIDNHITKYLDKLTKDIKGKVYRSLDKLVDQGLKRKEIADNISELIDSLKFRADFMDATEKSRAYNYGKAVGLKARGFEAAEIIKNDKCEICAEMPSEISLDSLDLDTIPPFHPNSKARVGKGL